MAPVHIDHLGDERGSDRAGWAAQMDSISFYQWVAGRHGGGGQISYRGPVSICKAGRARTEVLGEWREGRESRRKKNGCEIGTRKRATFVSKARHCFEKLLPLEPECQLASLYSRSAKGELCARPGQRVSSAPLLTCVFIRPPTLEIKFTRHFMFLLFMSSTAAHFMGFCLPLQAHFRSPPSVLRCHLLLSRVLPKFFFFLGGDISSFSSCSTSSLLSQTDKKPSNLHH